MYSDGWQPKEAGRPMKHHEAVSDAAVIGNNELTIQVVSTLGNYMKSLTTSKTAHVWSRNVSLYPLGLTQPVVC